MFKVYISKHIAACTLAFERLPRHAILAKLGNIDFKYFVHNLMPRWSTGSKVKMPWVRFRVGPKKLLGFLIIELLE